jgi:hypothetical protein
MDPDADSDPDIFVIDLQDANKKLYLKKSFFAYYILKVHLHHFQRKKVKKSQSSRNQGFSYYSCLVIEGSHRIQKHVDPDPQHWFVWGGGESERETGSRN